MVTLLILITLPIRFVLPPGGSYVIDLKNKEEVINTIPVELPQNLVSKIPDTLRWRLKWVIEEASKTPLENVEGFKFIDHNKDGIPDIVVRKENSVVGYLGPDFSTEFPPADSTDFGRKTVIDFDNDGFKEIVYLKKGRIVFNRLRNGTIIPQINYKKVFDFELPVSSCPMVLTPEKILVANLDGVFLLEKKNGAWQKKKISDIPFLHVQRINGDPRLVSSRGEIYEFTGVKLKVVGKSGVKNGVYFNGHWTSPELLPVKTGNISSIIASDINNDGKDDIIVGTPDGFLKIYLSPTYKADTSCIIKVKEWPQFDIFDVNNDGLKDLVIGDVDGNISYFKNTGTRSSPFFVETESWSFQKSYSIKTPSQYYSKYFPPEENFQISERWIIDSIISFLRHVTSPYFDEVVFCVAHTPPGVLRAMTKMRELDIFAQSAKDVYEIADSLPYVTIKELPNGLTTLVYDSTYELPPDYYYNFVVHPRILFEIPAKIDASYWDKPPEYYGESEDEWLTKNVEIYSKNGKFWRNYFLKIKKIREKMENAHTEREAVLTLHKWLSWSYKGNFMRFGYKTQDLQPLVIFKKRYGSCGEQSILLAAFARTFLIPIYVVMDRGEDHQWNEFWEKGKWHHWDLNFKAEKAIDHPMTSAEGMGAPGHKKTVSAVIAWHPDDTFHPVSWRYTGTAHVTFKVVDSAGRPIENALVVVRSHWNNRNSISIWGYTNCLGNVSFDLGYEPLGYTLDVLSIAGMGGINNFFVEEGDTYHFTVRMPDLLPYKHRYVEATSSILAIRNFVTGNPYRIRSKFLRDSIGYRGAGKTLYYFKTGRTLILRNTGGHLVFKNPSCLNYRIIDARIPTNPVLLLKSDEKSISPGDRIRFEFKIFPLTYFRKFDLHFGEKIFEFEPIHESKNKYDLEFTVNTIYPGTYKVYVTGTGNDGRVISSNKVSITLKPVKVYHGLVYQDECTSSHPSGSYVFGPIFIRDSIPFIYFKVTSNAEGADIDIFLFRDKNGNGKVDNMKELVKKSTTPLATEKIFVASPEKGEYWLYVQGCTIPQPPAKFKLITSFFLNKNGVVIFPGQ